MIYLGTYNQWLIEVAEKIANGYRIGMIPSGWRGFNPEYYERP